jgi:AMP deaminase
MAPAQDKETVKDHGTNNVDVFGDPDEEPGQSTPSLVIPETRDGFFGYNEEKSLQHVSPSDPIF